MKNVGREYLSRPIDTTTDSPEPFGGYYTLFIQ